MRKSIIVIFVVIFAYLTCVNVLVTGGLRDCFKRLKAEMSVEAQDAFASMPEETAIWGAYRFGLGLWIRNNLLRHGGSKLPGRLILLGYFGYDDDSVFILTSFWRHLNNRPLHIFQQSARRVLDPERDFIPRDTASPADGSKIEFFLSEPRAWMIVFNRGWEHFGFSKSDGSLWAYRKGEGVYKPGNRKYKELMGMYRFDVKSGRVIYIRPRGE